MFQGFFGFLLIAFLLVVYSTKVKCWQPEYLMKIFLQVCRLADTQELIWFPSLELDAQNSEKVDEFMVFMHENLGITQMVITNRTDLRIMYTSSKRNYFSVTFTTGLNDPILHVHDRVMLGRHYGLNLFIMVQKVDEFVIIEQIVREAYDRNFQNLILYVQSTNGTNALWSFEVYPEFKVRNHTDIFAYLASNMRHLRSDALDTLGLKLKTPLRQDLPYVLSYKNEFGQTIRHGTSYKMMALFIEFINATLVNYKMPPDSRGGEIMNMKDALDLVREKKVPFLTHAYALYASDDGVGRSYPIMVVKWCLMVPIWNSVSTFFYPVQPFANIVWYAFIGTFFALAITDLALIFWQFRKNLKVPNSKRKLKKIIRQSLLNDFCYVINISSGNSLSSPTSVIRAFLYLTVFFYGFFLSANYTSLLGSILTVNLFRQNINTMDDLIRTNISVMIIDYELDFLLNGSNDLSSEFRQLLLPVDVAIFNQHQLALNTSYAYFITDDKWHFIQRQQEYLKQGVFKFTDICFGSHHLVYPMRPDSPIWRSLEYYIFRMHSSGMLQHYESTSFDFAIRANLMTRFSQANEYTSAGMQHLFVVFMLLMIVSVISFFVFLAECFLFRCCEHFQVQEM